jgi:hypothetical protein
MKIRWPLKYVYFDIVLFVFVFSDIMWDNINWWLALFACLCILIVTNIVEATPRVDGWNELKNKTFIDNSQNPNSSTISFYEENGVKKVIFGRKEK